MSSSSGFGLLNYSGNANVLKQLESVQEKLQRSKNLSTEYSAKYKQLVELNKNLANGYIHNLNVIIDLSRVLSEYKETMKVVIDTLQRFDDDIFKEMESVNTEHLQVLTEESLRNIGSYFTDEVQKVRTILLSLGKNDLVERIDKSHTQFSTIVNGSSSLKGGACQCKRHGKSVYPTKRQLKSALKAKQECR